MTKETQTRLNQTIWTTDEPGSYPGMYLAEDVRRTWTEEIADADTGEIESIERTEMILPRGERITYETAATLAFHISTGDITEVALTDQKREAKEWYGHSMNAYKVSAVINDKKLSFLLNAQCVQRAIEVAADWIELNYKGWFEINGAKCLPGIVLINSREEAEADSENEEIEADTAKYYKVEIEYSVLFEDREPIESNGSFITKAPEADAAVESATAWAIQKAKKIAEGGVISSVSSTLISAVPYGCTTIIDHDFCMAYKDVQ